MAKHKKTNKIRNNIITTSKISIGMLASMIAISGASTSIIPSASAESMQTNGNTHANNDVAVAVRAFPAQNSAVTVSRGSLRTEIASIDNVDGSWSLGSDENIGANIMKDAERQTNEINARKAAEEAKRKAEEDAKQKQQAEEERRKAEEEARNNNAIINADNNGFDGSNDSQYNAPDVDYDAISSKHGADIVKGALNHIGEAMWCTDLASAALNDAGIGFPVLWPEQYVNVPGSANIGTDISKAEPGDLIIYERTGANGAHNDHISVYIGNGLAVHGGWNYSADVEIATYNVGKIWAIIRVN